MKRAQLGHLVGVILLLVVAVGTPDGFAGATEITPPPVVRQSQDDNLLVNPSMEDGFYWMPPNHFVANGWQRWWLGDGIPEYDDVRDWRPWRYDGDHAQVYFRWGVSYTAGIYQRVNVRPCTFYKFDIYGRNHSGEAVNHHAKIGIDPLGRDYDLYLSSLPDDIVWSPETTYLFVWGLHSVTAESRSDRITVITYVSPDNVYTPYDTFWDAGSLLELPPSPGPLPTPQDWAASTFIFNITAYAQDDRLVIEWDTAEPASSQVWYRVQDAQDDALWRKIYLPLVFSSRPTSTNVPDLPQYTPADRSSNTHHRAVITGLSSGQGVYFAVLARHLVGDECVTVASAVRRATWHPEP